ncbi:hypothetical protein, partial [Escherichia coli]|uniref:hypothetical protein n=1 Tax=Escherichia coli TaxID=562 RepID=UPI001BC8802C
VHRKTTSPDCPRHALEHGRILFGAAGRWARLPRNGWYTEKLPRQTAPGMHWNTGVFYSVPPGDGQDCL